MRSVSVKYKIFMKKGLFSAVFFVLAAVLTVLPLGENFAAAQNYGALNPAAFIESLKTELSLLKMLLTNMNAKSEINSPAYIAVDLESGKTLLSKNSEQARPAASITKMMTATIARENIDENKKITLTDSMLAPAGNSSVLYAGREIDIKTLLKAVLIQSSNDAAEALAQAAGKENFLALMNQKAAELGMENTVFFDPCGLNPKNKSTPADLAKLVAYVHKNHPEILAIGKSNDF